MEEVSFMTMKGGQGCSTFAAGAALLAPHASVLLVDWHDDQPAVLGIAQPYEDYSPQPVNDKLELASSAWWIDRDPDADRWDLVVHDWGFTDDSALPPGDIYLVTKPCYLALRRASSMTTKVNGVILLAEPERALTKREVENIVGPVVVEVPYSPVIARAIDSGLLSGRPPKDLQALLGAFA